ncbi:MAG: (2Fe-2S)-binding protein [Chamaesiphon sp.]|nr:(2Fe-2S)-binding protein [Chamaesiphon sp.]
MPQVKAQGKTFECNVGDNLYQVLSANDVKIFNGNAKTINCSGNGACGSCTVQVDGKVSPPNWIENIWHSLPFVTAMGDRRLSCQTQVLGDIEVIKYEGFLGRGAATVWTSAGDTDIKIIA